MIIEFANKINFADRKGDTVKAWWSCTGSASQVSRMGEEESAFTVPIELRVPQSAPHVITSDKNAAYPKAIAEPKGAGMLPKLVALTAASNTSIT